MNITNVKLEIYLFSLLWFMALLLLLILFSNGLSQMLSHWHSAEYSHGFFIPLIAAFLVSQKLSTITTPPKQYWAAILFLLIGLSMLLIGELGTLFTVIQYGFLFALTGLMVAMVGFNGLKDLVGPIGYLLFMIPLPDLFQYNLSSQLQLLSSAIGVQVIRLLNISVFLEGNIIDLGKYQLQVVDACSGLRYLFPLMSFGFLFASLYHTSNWQRWLLFLSTTPITILMNSLRIALAGILVNYGGTSLAEGFLHDFEGWVIFVGCIGLLLFETYILHKLNRSPGSVFDQFYVKWPDLAVWLEKLKEAKSWYSLITFNLLLLLAMPLTIMLQERAEKLPLRSQLANFPLEHKNWTGKERRMEPNIINSLKLSDFLATDFVYDDSSAPVNFYIAYYKSQRKGAAVHSPKSCLPAGGWRIMNSQQILIKAVTTNDGRTFQCNRALVNKGDQRILMYYWFQQRGRTITNEYMVKWYLFWDALNHNRTDGALIRLSVSLDEKMDEIDADKYLKHFLHDFYPLLNRYLPT